MKPKYIIRCDRYQWQLCRLKTSRDGTGVSEVDDPYTIIGNYTLIETLLHGVREHVVRDGTKSGQSLEAVLDALAAKIAHSDSEIVERATAATNAVIKMRTNLPLVERARAAGRARLAKLKAAAEAPEDAVDGPEAEQVTALDALAKSEYTGPSTEKRIAAAKTALEIK